jgi:hypothetical protein
LPFIADIHSSCGCSIGVNESDDAPCASARRAPAHRRGHGAEARNDRPPLLHILLGHVSLQMSASCLLLFNSGYG